MLPHLCKYSYLLTGGTGCNSGVFSFPQFHMVRVSHYKEGMRKAKITQGSKEGVKERKARGGGERTGKKEKKGKESI